MKRAFPLRLFNSFTRRSSRQARGCIGQYPRGTTYVSGQRLECGNEVTNERWSYNLISFSAFSTESDPWQMLKPTDKAKSPRMVPRYQSVSITMINKEFLKDDGPGEEARGLVAPSIARPVLTASKPSQTVATTGPEDMYSISRGKKGLSLRSS